MMYNRVRLNKGLVLFPHHFENTALCRYVADGAQGWVAPE